MERAAASTGRALPTFAEALEAVKRSKWAARREQAELGEWCEHCHRSGVISVTETEAGLLLTDPSLYPLGQRPQGRRYSYACRCVHGDRFRKFTDTYDPSILAPGAPGKAEDRKWEAEVKAATRGFQEHLSTG